MRSLIFWDIHFVREDQRIVLGNTSSASARRFLTRQARTYVRRFGAGSCTDAAIGPSRIFRVCTTRLSGVGSSITGGFITRRFILLCVSWIGRWPDGPIGSTRSCEAISAERGTGWRGFRAGIQVYSHTGRWACGVVPWLEPYELRGSRTVLGERRGAIPLRHSPPRVKSKVLANSLLSQFFGVTKWFFHVRAPSHPSPRA